MRPSSMVGFTDHSAHYEQGGVIRPRRAEVTWEGRVPVQMALKMQQCKRKLCL